MLIVLFVLPFYSHPNYSIVKHTSNQLGAQLTVNSWVMNFVFVALGVAVLLAGWQGLKGIFFS